MENSKGYHTKNCVECNKPLNESDNVMCKICRMKFDYLHNKKKNNDNFEMMWDLQNEFQFNMLKTEKNQENLNLFCLASIDELMSAIEETKWKPWKEGQQFNKEKYLTELVDVMHYIIIMAQMKGISSKEFFDSFITKQMINRAKYIGDEDNGR